MKDRELKASLERAEAAYEDLIRTRASLGTMLAEAMRREGGLPEFRRRMEDLPLLIRSADIRRTELRIELLGRRLKEAQDEHRRATEEATRASAALEEARRTYTRAVNVEQRFTLEVQRLEQLHQEQQGRLLQLRSEESERKEVTTS
jgi:maltooligosyltrehalose synthase